LIARTVREHQTAASRTLILCERIEHVETLAALLADLQPVLLTGRVKASARAAARRTVRDGVPLAIATASLVGEGADLPPVDQLVLATPFSGGSRTLQAVGRVVRVHPGKSSATVIDIVDGLVPALVNAHRKRLAVYQQVCRE
jgi:superfamily II DNA or RNA helicase